MGEHEEIVELRGLGKHYENLRAVEDLSLSIHRGEIFGLLGPNGAGKTTTINMLCGLLKPSAGSITIRDRSGNRHGARGAAVGLCPQEIILWEGLTCLEQLVFMAEMYDIRVDRAKERALALLDAMGLVEKKDQLAKTLSGGMQRRLNIILALVHEPTLLVLDEPQAGLDPQSRVLVRDYIRSLKNEMTVILTTHDMEEADKLSDRVAIMDRGRLLVVDTPSNLKRRGGNEELLELSLGEADRQSCDSLISRLAAKEMTVTRKEDYFLIATDNARAGFEMVMRFAREEGVAIEDLRVRRRTLEDVFIDLTGRGLRE